jgi:hypothetical protein
MPAALSPDYRHRHKTAHPTTVLMAGGEPIKWYDLDEAAFPVMPDVQRAARAHLAAGLSAATDIAGFAILHRCGPTFHFLLTSLWRGNNELWQTVDYADPPDTGFAPFQPAYPAAGSARPTFCVWELGIVAHEALAWQRFLRSDRSDAARDAWQADVLTADV